MRNDKYSLLRFSESEVMIGRELNIIYNETRRHRIQIGSTYVAFLIDPTDDLRRILAFFMQIVDAEINASRALGRFVSMEGSISNKRDSDAILTVTVRRKNRRVSNQPKKLYIESGKCKR